MNARSSFALETSACAVNVCYAQKVADHCFLHARIQRGGGGVIGGPK